MTSRSGLFLGSGLRYSYEGLRPVARARRAALRGFNPQQVVGALRYPPPWTALVKIIREAGRKVTLSPVALGFALGRPLISVIRWTPCTYAVIDGDLINRWGRVYTKPHRECKTEIPV